MTEHGGDGGGVSGIGVVGIVRGDDGGAGEALGELGFGHVFGAVASTDMAYLMTEDAGELAVGLETVQERAGDEDLAAGEGEGVNGLAV